MGSSTPPRMQGSGFFKHFATPKSKPKVVYYEDLYGSPNEDEEFDRFPEACDEESDSQAEESKRFSKSAEYKRFFTGSYAGSSVRRPKNARPSTPPNVEQNTPRSEKRYKIAPNINPSQSTDLSSLQSHGLSEELGFEGDTEEEVVSGNSPSALADQRRSKTSFGNRMLRPTSRRLFKQELAEQDKNTKESKAARAKEEKRMTEIRRKEKTASRRAKMPKESAKSRNTTNKAAKLTEDLGGDNARSAYREAQVVIDLTAVDVEEYEYFSD